MVAVFGSHIAQFYKFKFGSNVVLRDIPLEDFTISNLWKWFSLPFWQLVQSPIPKLWHFQGNLWNGAAPGSTWQCWVITAAKFLVCGFFLPVLLGRVISMCTDVVSDSLGFLLAVLPFLEAFLCLRIWWFREVIPEPRCLNKTKGRSVMEELGARGSLQDLMEKGPLFRRGFYCGECIFLKTKLSMEKSIPKSCKSFGRIFLLLPGYHWFCSWVIKGKIS